MQIKNKHLGFTVIELLITLTIVGILAVFGIQTYSGHIESTKVTTANNLLKLISLAQEEYRSEFSNYFCPSDNLSNINQALFAGRQTLADDEMFSYSISCLTNGYRASIQINNSTTTEPLCIDHLNRSDCS